MSALIITGANYGSKDVKAITNSLVNWQEWNPSSLTLDSANYNNTLGGDPLPGWQKSFVVLFHYGDTDARRNARISISLERSGNLNVLSGSSGAPLPQIPHDIRAPFEILALTYGPKLIDNPAVYKALYASLILGNAYVVTNDSMGGDTMQGTKKTAVLVFKDHKNGQIRTIGCIEGASLKN